MANIAEDRLDKILHQKTVTGIDYIYVHKDQKTLDVHFLRSLVDPSDPPAKLLATLTAEDIRIYNPSGEVPDIHVMPFLSPPPPNATSWNDDTSLRLNLMSSGDFTLYRLKINDLRVGLDSFYNDVTFDFKANCPSDLDCAPPEHECPPDTPVDFPIDYLARDFWSFRTALLDFASLRYPDWTDRLEADAGVMMAEVMSALGDEMAYYQDRISREAYLETATQRRSLRHHAQLVDYSVHDGLGASGWLDVQAISANTIPVGIDIWAISDGGQKIDFEVGRGFEYNRKNEIKSHGVSPQNNEFSPHIWDKNQICLPVGTTELYLEGNQTASLKFDDFPKEGKNKTSGKWVLLKTQPTNAAQPIRKMMVRLIEIEKTTDTVFNKIITRIVWEQAQALPFEFDLTTLVIHGNLVPISAGKTYTMFFIVGAEVTDLPTAEQTALNEVLKKIGAYDTARAIEREGKNKSISYLFTLPNSEIQPLVWLGTDPHEAQPEILLREIKYNVVKDCWNEGDVWEPKRSFIGVNSSESPDKDYVLEDGSWRRVVGYQRIGEEFVHRDYAANKGTTIRFGDGEFGFIPAKNTVFRVDYRLGGGRQSNVAADSLIYFADNRQQLESCKPILKDLSFIKSVTNPLNTENGIDAELPNDIRQSAPQAFRAVTYRAVRPEDYAEAAERLTWVQRAGATFRWTGSWQTAFVTPDPYGMVTLEEPKRQELVEQLDRFRQAGREAYTLDPIYADLDIEIEVCAAPTAYAGEVKERVWAALIGKNGYFSPDKFTFGMPLERSTLETVIQNTEGVRAVEKIYIRRRGWFDWQPFTDFHYDPGKNVIIRVENDPLHPNRGSVNLKIHGGA